MLTKKRYVRPHKDLTGNDLNIEDFPHTMRVWRDPSRQVVFTLLDTITMTSEKLDGLDDAAKKDLDSAFWVAVSEVIIDCDIEGLDFSTPEKAKESFDSPHISWGVLFDVLFAYVSWLLTENDRLKKLFRPASNQPASGENKKRLDVK
jgi:hypothetical protein